MPTVTYENAKRLTATKGYLGIASIPKAHREQRGPTCGFSALAYVLDYWHQKSLTEEKSLPPPLPARTNMKFLQEGTEESKARKAQGALDHKFTSLRHYAKHRSLTVLGSVFSANDLLSIAKGAQTDVYDGKVIGTSVDRFAIDIEEQLRARIPVIVPFDVDGDDGMPISKGGNQAHWVAVLGSFDHLSARYLLYFNWGKFQYAPLKSFAASNAQLHSNNDIELKKYRIFSPGGDQRSLYEKMWLTENSVLDYKKADYEVEGIPGKVRMNLEHNDCRKSGASASSSPGIVPAHSCNGGLLCKLVAVYPIGYDPTANSSPASLTGSSTVKPAAPVSSSSSSAPSQPAAPDPALGNCQLF